MLKRVMTGTLLALGLSGCVNIQGPLTIGTEVGSSKVGRACLTQRLLSVKGDASIDAAKRQGNITRVSTVDTELSTKLLWASEFCTVVRGE